jgi:hypothetical protein
MSLPRYSYICVSLPETEPTERILSRVLVALDAVGIPKTEQNRLLQEVVGDNTAHVLRAVRRVGVASRSECAHSPFTEHQLKECGR